MYYVLVCTCILYAPNDPITLRNALFLLNIAALKYRTVFASIQAVGLFLRARAVSSFVVRTVSKWGPRG